MSDDEEFAQPQDGHPDRRKKGELVSLGPKLAPRWAEVYCDIMLKRGREAAVTWAKVFLKSHDDRKLLKEAAEALIKKRGIYRDPPPPGVA